MRLPSKHHPLVGRSDDVTFGKYKLKRYKGDGGIGISMPLAGALQSHSRSVFLVFMLL
jgi:hypothetical protein